MTNQVNQAFEEWFNNEFKDLTPSEYSNNSFEIGKSNMRYGWQASQQQSAGEIKALKERVAELQSHLSNQVIEITLNDITLEACASKIAELQADNNQLREALEICKYDCHTGEVIGIAEKALKAPPTQSCEML